MWKERCENGIKAIGKLIMKKHFSKAELEYEASSQGKEVQHSLGMAVPYID